MMKRPSTQPLPSAQSWLTTCEASSFTRYRKTFSTYYPSMDCGKPKDPFGSPFLASYLIPNRFVWNVAFGGNTIIAIYSCLEPPFAGSKWLGVGTLVAAVEILGNSWPISAYGKDARTSRQVWVIFPRTLFPIAFCIHHFHYPKVRLPIDQTGENTGQSTTL